MLIFFWNQTTTRGGIVVSGHRKRKKKQLQAITVKEELQRVEKTLGRKLKRDEETVLVWLMLNS